MVTDRNVLKRDGGDFAGVFTVEPDRGAGGRRGDGDAAGLGGMLDDQKAAAASIQSALLRKPARFSTARSEVTLRSATPIWLVPV